MTAEGTVPRAAPDRRPAVRRLPFLALGFASLIAGMFGGFVRLGWISLPVPMEAALAHGPLMVCGFFGTLIGLERAVALGRAWTYVAPAAAGIGGAAALAGAPSPLPQLLVAAASLVLAAASLQVALRHRALYSAVMAAGAVSWVVGNVLWLAGAEMAGIVPWWMLFLLLTIAGERLELRRMLRPERADRALFLAAAALSVAGGIAATLAPESAWLLGLGLVALALWLGRYDVARRTIRQSGLVRFAAACLLSGYAWLGLAGLLMLASPGDSSGSLYDAVLHAFFLGFVFAMVFAHAPIILPAVTRLNLPYRPVFYLHLAALQVSLVLRMVGDLAGLDSARFAGGIGNGLAILLFLVLTADSLRRGRAAGDSQVTSTRPE
jgi:hypothetical protein